MIVNMPAMQKNDDLDASTFETELAKIASWWLTYGIDRTSGGVHGEIADDNTVKRDADRGANLEARALWFFSAYAAFSGDETARAAADALYRYFLHNFLDEAYGGFFWSVTAKGAPASTRKQTYAQAFAIYALCAYGRLGGGEGPVRQATALAQLLERHVWDQGGGGYIEAFSRDWSPIEDFRLSDRDLNAPKTMNTHLHVLEAYTSLYLLTRDEFARALLEKILRLFDARFAAPRGGRHLALFYSMDWQDQCGDESYGHDIEASWLLYEAAEALGDEFLLDGARKRALSLAEASLAALDQDGGLIYERHAGAAPDRTRHWWPQAEAMVGFHNAYELSGDQRFREAAGRIWSFIRTHHIDHARGEWFWHAAADKNAVNPYKAGFWKGPYHNGRAMMEMIRRLKGGGHG